MTEINDFLQKVNTTPSFLAEVDWREETAWFDKNRIKLIIMGIKRDDVCEVVEEYITLNWYKTELDADDFYRTFMLSDVDKDEFGNYCDPHLRFRPENYSLYEKDYPTIENYIGDVKVERNRKNEREKRLQQLKNKSMQLESRWPKATKEEAEAYEKRLPYEMCESLMITIQNRNAEIKELLAENHELESKNNELNSEWNLIKNDKEKLINETKNKTIRDFVQQLIIYAEKFPSNQNDKAEVIKQALLVKEHNGFIPTSVLDEKWNKRLMNLGRKEPPGLRVDNLTANNLYDVHNNGKVKL